MPISAWYEKQQTNKQKKKEKKKEKKLAYDVMPTCAQYEKQKKRLALDVMPISAWYATLFMQTWYTHSIPHTFNNEAVRLGDSWQGTYLHDQECGNPG